MPLNREWETHSRSILAGYSPAVLFSARILVVGAGALGQNELIDLALAGVGEIELADFDVFEPHNATRSPLYPSEEERRRWGDAKATVAAYKLQAMMTAPAPLVRHAVAPIQALGDLPIGRADLIISAVDNPAARCYLQERCRILGKPLFEAGFHGPSGTLSAFGPNAKDPCYRCLNPERAGAFSCTRYALEAEAEKIIPAIQNTAAALAALQVEQVIQWLHGNETACNRRAYLDIRSLELRVVRLSRDPGCPGVHHRNEGEPADLAVRPQEPLARLLDSVRDLLGPAVLCLPEPLVMRIPCQGCRSLTEARAPEWRWLASPRCQDCGGPFPAAAPGRAPSSVDRLDSEYPDEAYSLTCEEAGLPAGMTVEATPYDGPSRLVRLAGAIDMLMPTLPTLPTL